MAKVRFNLKRPKAEISSIVCTLTEGRGYELKLSTGISIKPKHWSSKGYVLSADVQAAAHNAKIKDWSNRVLDTYNTAIANGIVPDRNYLYQALKPKQEKEALTFWEIWSIFIESKKGIFKKHSFTKFGSLKVHLEDFEKASKKALHLDEITSELMEDFQNYLYHKPKKSLNTQSTEKYLGIFKIFLNWCVKRRYTKNMDFRNFTATRQPDGLKVIMTDEDILKIQKADLGEKNYLKNVRSLFLLACSTGLRFSDFSRINSQHLKEDQDGAVLNIRQQKTEDFVYIPLTKEALQTVRDLINGEVRPISNQKMNSYVKELCRTAGINEEFEVTHYKGREKTTTIVPKCDLVSTHTGRRTFATNLLRKGVPAQVVMTFTGHRDYKSFSKYVNIPKRAEMQIVRQALEGTQAAGGSMWKAS